MTLTKVIRTGAVALGALAVAAQANAADIYSGGGGMKDVPVIAPPIWTGFYAGINLGAAWSDLDINRNTYYDREYGATWCTTPACQADHSGYFNGKNLNSENAFGGGQFGYNWQSGAFVYGLEVDLEGLGGNGQQTFTASTWTGRYNTLTKQLGTSAPNLESLAAVTVKEDGGFAGDVTGRLGYTWGNWMLYAKGGFAWFDPDISAKAAIWDRTYGVATIGGNNDNNNTLTGWTIGAGVEWLLNPNWSVKLEYLYYDFGLNNNNWNMNYTLNNVTYSNNDWKWWNNDLTVNTVKLGVNYHLNNNYVPLK